jgi:hypothetical protein
VLLGNPLEVPGLDHEKKNVDRRLLSPVTGILGAKPQWAEDLEPLVAASLAGIASSTSLYAGDSMTQNRAWRSMTRSPGSS